MATTAAATGAGAGAGGTKVDLSRLLENLSALEDQLLLCLDNIHLQKSFQSKSASQRGADKPMILPYREFAIEQVAGEVATNVMLMQGRFLLENSQKDTSWYMQYFLGKPHQVFLGLDDAKEPYVLAVLTTDAETRGILWRKSEVHRMSFPTTKDKMDILKAMSVSFAKWPKPKEIVDRNIYKDVHVLEEQTATKRYKFGVIYACEGQVSDDEFLNNETGSPDLNEFLRIMGDYVDQKGWKGYRAGLDVSAGNTGEKSLYTEFEGCEVMFHVSTLLPYSPTIPQQLERKRHIGNDIVVIIFQEGKATPFSPAFMRSQFNHIFIVVRKELVEGKPCYRLSICRKKDVPEFGPQLPNPPLFFDPKILREFLLTKCINGENSAYTAPVFRHKLVRTMEGLLKNIQRNYMDQSKSSKKGAEDGPIDHGESLKKQIMEDREAVRVALTHRHDTNKWKPNVWFEKFPVEITCADSWKDKLVAGTNDGVYLIEGNGNKRKIIDSGSYVQLNVIEESRILVLLQGKGGCIYCVDLADFDNPKTCLSAKAMDNLKIDKTKGCHLYALSEKMEGADASSFKICACVKSNLVLVEYTNRDFYGQGAGKFKKLKDFVLPSQCLVLSFCDNNNRLCVGFKTEFDLIDIQTSKIDELFVGEAKYKPIAAIPLKSEILICYNHIGMFKSFSGKHRGYDLVWTSVPSGVAYCFPFVLAVANGTIEVRTLINGKLTQMISADSVQLLTSKADVFFTSVPPDRQASGEQDILQLSAKEMGR